MSASDELAEELGEQPVAPEPPAPAGSYAAASDVGRLREHNEDYAYAGPVPGAEEWLLLIVADGVGGHGHGEWASQRAVENVALTIAGHLKAGEPGRALALASIRPLGATRHMKLAQ